MKRSQRIKAIVEIKAVQEKNALEALGASRKKMQEIEAQLENLKNYRRDYQERFNRLGGEGASAARLMEFRSFMDKLDTAIRGQELSLQGSQAEFRAKKKHWENRHNQTASLQKVCDTAVVTEKKLDDKIEQEEQDEWATRFVMGR
ncbi:flagellar export protein FliJ [Methylomicrobium agile]|uniref:flagellar export protein FliJ n=1 Tax=Methylomicrobium agile TaxID=39774 RepID=UPI0004DF8EC1|nr:flagellar export protein FliJ [Methylomicrobium agile]